MPFEYQKVPGYTRPTTIKKPSGFSSIASWRVDVVDYIEQYEEELADNRLPEATLEFVRNDLADQKHFLHLIDTGCVTE